MLSYINTQLFGQINRVTCQLNGIYSNTKTDIKGISLILENFVFKYQRNVEKHF